MADFFESSYPTSDIASWFNNDNTRLYQALAGQPDISFPLEEIPVIEEVRPNTVVAVFSNFTITPDVSEMRRVFDQFDDNNDGLICSQDLRCFMRRLGYHLTEGEAQQMLESVDGNQDGCVNFEEFLSLYRSLCGGEETSSSSASTSSSYSACASTRTSNSSMEVEKLRVYEEDSTLLEAFHVFDRNQDGVITAEELQSVLLDLGMPEGVSLRSCEQMIESVDVDGNGVIDIAEFRELMTTSFAFC